MKPELHAPGPPRTYVRREGRLTPGQRKALEQWLPRYRYPAGGLAPASVFGNSHPCTLEIGFGNGENLAHQANKHPEINYIGLEVHRPGVGHLLQQAAAAELNNLRVSTDDATHFLTHLPPACLDVVQIFFPDPWPKKRHHKRRMIRPDVVTAVARTLKPGGSLLLATDWDNYAEQMMEVMSQHAAFQNTRADNGFAARADRVLTRFEARAHRLGHKIHDLHFRRC